MTGKIILLVEDNPDDAALTLDAVRQSDLRSPVVVVEDGIAALDFLFRTGPYARRDVRHDPALMLLDLKLPRLDGLEVLRRTRSDARTRWLPIVILTCSKEPQDIIRSYELGANSYVRKPVDFDTFVEVIREIGTYWVSLNELPPATALP